MYRVIILQIVTTHSLGVDGPSKSLASSWWFPHSKLKSRSKAFWIPSMLDKPVPIRRRSVLTDRKNVGFPLLRTSKHGTMPNLIKWKKKLPYNWYFDPSSFFCTSSFFLLKIFGVLKQMEKIFFKKLLLISSTFSLLSSAFATYVFQFCTLRIPWV